MKSLQNDKYVTFKTVHSFKSTGGDFFIFYFCFQFQFSSYFNKFVLFLSLHVNTCVSETYKSQPTCFAILARLQTDKSFPLFMVWLLAEILRVLINSALFDLFCIFVGENRRVRARFLRKAFYFVFVVLWLVFAILFYWEVRLTKTSVIRYGTLWLFSTHKLNRDGI